MPVRKGHRVATRLTPPSGKAPDRSHSCLWSFRTPTASRSLPQGRASLLPLGRSARRLRRRHCLRGVLHSCPWVVPHADCVEITASGACFTPALGSFRTPTASTSLPQGRASLLPLGRSARRLRRDHCLRGVLHSCPWVVPHADCVEVTASGACFTPALGSFRTPTASRSLPQGRASLLPLGRSARRLRRGHCL